MVSPVFVFKGATLVADGPVAFLVPSYTPLAFPASAEDYVLTEFQPVFLGIVPVVHWALLLAALRASKFCVLGTCL